MFNNLAILVAACILLALLIGVGYFGKKWRKTGLKAEKFQEKWTDLQKLLGNKATWPLAIINADKLLDEALRKRRIKGKTMGERLVTAQHEFSRNDQIWQAHKLRNKLVHDDRQPAINKKMVMNTMITYRQALKELGALK